MPGPDFPTGGLIVDPRAAIEEAYATGRGSFRVRARWKKEDTGRGTYLIVITEIPWLVQKTRLIERMAELFNDKKLPLVAEFRDESTEDVRVVIEPKSRTVDPGILMESLFKLTELESRIPLNMNVLSKGKVPKVMDLAELIKEWLDHRRDVLVRRSKNRLAQIEHRLEVLGGFLVAYLNLDKVIKIIRNEDEPKPVLIKAFKLSDVQADAILNMRLRNLRKLEEMEIKRENKDLREEKIGLEKLIRSDKEQWKTVAGQIKEVREKFNNKTPLGKRRTDFAEAPEHDEAAIEEAMVVREPITVVVSEKGWIRALRGHVRPICPGWRSRPTMGRPLHFRPRPRRRSWRLPATAAFTRSMRPSCPAGAATASRSGSMPTSSRMANWCRCSAIRAGGSSWSRASPGSGFVVAEDECLANTRKGKQVLNVKPPDAARAVTPVEGELVAAVGENRKMVIFALDQVPEMGRGRGVRLQRHKDGGLSDVTTFKADDGLRWIGERRPDLEPLHQGARRLARQPRRRRPRAPRPLPRQSEIRQAPRNATARTATTRTAAARRSKLRFVTAPGRRTCTPNDARRQLTTKTMERSDFSRMAVAVSPKNSFSPGRRSTPMTIRLCLRLAISLRMASSASFSARTAVRASTS